MKAVLVLVLGSALASCTTSSHPAEEARPIEEAKPAAPQPNQQAPASDAPDPPTPTTPMTDDKAPSTDCKTLKQAMARRDFVGWQGLNPACKPDELFDGYTADPKRFRRRRLGRDKVDAQATVLELAGYYRPHVNVRDGAVVLFDGKPDLDASALFADLGDPEAKLDTYFGTLEKPEGEWVWASRGIAIWKSGDKVFHLAVFAPTSVESYRDTLSPDLRKRRR